MWEWVLQSLYLRKALTTFGRYGFTEEGELQELESVAFRLEISIVHVEGELFLVRLIFF